MGTFGYREGNGGKVISYFVFKINILKCIDMLFMSIRVAIVKDKTGYRC